MNAPGALPGLGRLWWGIAASPAAWVLAELVGYPMVARSCEPSSGGLDMHGFAHPRAWMVGLAILLAVVAGSGLWTAWTSVRTTSGASAGAAKSLARGADAAHGASWGRARFMAVAGVFVSSIFLVGTVLYGLPSLIVNACAQVR